MGAAVSVMSVENSPELTKAIRSEYYLLCQQGLNDGDILSMMKEKFEDKILKVQPTATVKTQHTQEVQLRTTAVSRALEPKKEVKDSKTIRRERQSFAGGDIPPPTSKPELAMKKSASEAQGQGGGRTRVLSYQGVPSSSSTSKKPVIVQDGKTKRISAAVVKQEAPAPYVEGVDYRLIHSEIKLFWRANTSLELSFYLHAASSCLELVMYNIDKEQETSNRLYFDYVKLLLVTTDDVSKRIEKRKGELSARVLRRSLTQDTPSEEIINYEAQLAAIVSYISERLRLEVDENALESVTYDASIASKSGIGESLLLVSLPSGASPAVKAWAKNKKAEDVQKVYDELMACATDIVGAAKKGGHAEKVLQLSYMAAEYMQKVMQRHQKLRLMGYSEMRLKWILAYRRVRAQIAVKQVTQILDKFLLRHIWDEENRRYKTK